jgi:hypothetical protein
LGAVAGYCLFAVVPSTLAAVRAGTERGDVRKDALVFAQAYGSDVATYFAGAPRAAKILELSALVILPVVLYLLALPCSNVRFSLQDLRRTAWGAAALVLLGHSVVYIALLGGNGSGSVAWSWMWRLAALTMVSSAAELGLIALSLYWLGGRRWLAFSLLAGVALIGVALRLFRGCGIPLVPGCVDASLLSGRPSEQLCGALIATLWLVLAVVIVGRLLQRRLPAGRRDRGVGHSTLL